jgi:hypothetical protein
MDFGATTANFTLTGLTNFMDYTIEIEAKGSTDSVIAKSTTVTVSPTAIFVYLPVVARWETAVPRRFAERASQLTRQSQN